MSQTLHQQIARAASRLLARPERWNCQSLARGPDGKPCLPLSETAVRWCMRGALMKCAHDIGLNPIAAYLIAVNMERSSGTYPITGINDHCSFRRMRATMRKMATNLSGP